MKSVRSAVSLLILLLLFAHFGCRRTESGPDAAGDDTAVERTAEAGDTPRVDLGRPKPPLPPSSTPPPPRNAGRRAPGDPAGLPVSPAFFAPGDLGPGTSSPRLFDYELGAIRFSLPEGLEESLGSLGGELPEAWIAPEYQAHLLRQSLLFEPSDGQLVLARGREQGGILAARFKRREDGEMLVGSLLARRTATGYLLEDIVLERRLKAPFEALVLPPPLREGL